MTKRNLIVLIIGAVILLTTVGWFSYSYFKNKPVVTTTPPPPTATTTAITFSQDEIKILSRIMGLPPDEIPGVYKEKIGLYKEKLKNDCLANRNNVKQFFSTIKDDDSLGALLNEMKNITVSMDLIPIKTSPEGKDLGFKIHPYVLLECYNPDKEKFKECQSRLNGLEIDNKNAEEVVMAKITNFPNTLGEYLQCKAVEQRDKNLCSKIYLSSNWRSDCQNIVGRLNFMTSVYFQPNCENLCQKEKADIDEEFTAEDCLIVCQAIKNSDVNECEKLADKTERIYCVNFITFDLNNCQKIEPKILKYKQLDGTIRERNQVADCQAMTLFYKSVKENNADILREVKTEPKVDLDYLNYLKNLYFGNKGCEANFDKLYENYCNLKWGS
jgi:hypothetical protein